MGTLGAVATLGSAGAGGSSSFFGDMVGAWREGQGRAGKEAARRWERGCQVVVVVVVVVVVRPFGRDRFVQ